MSASSIAVAPLGLLTAVLCGQMQDAFDRREIVG